AGFQYSSIVGVFKKSGFTADALYGVIGFKAAIVLSETETLQGRAKRTHHGAEIPWVVLEVADCFDPCLLKYFLGDTADAWNCSNRHRTQKLHLVSFRD